MDIPSSHLIFIPAVLLIGIAIGFVLGNRAARDAYNLELRRQTERDAARKARAEKKRARAAATKTEAAEAETAETAEAEATEAETGTAAAKT